jgi:hypothetical protein
MVAQAAVVYDCNAVTFLKTNSLVFVIPAKAAIQPKYKFRAADKPMLLSRCAGLL